MDLLLDLNQSEGVWIDGNHRVFEKSEFEGLKFRFQIKPLTRTELRRFRRETATKNGDQDSYLPKIFTAQVLDWELKDANNKSIPFTEDMKKILVENFPGLTNLVAAACLDANVKIAEALEEETKN